MLTIQSTEAIENTHNPLTTKKHTTKQGPRHPLTDLSNRATEPYHHHTMEAALKETLEENRRVHEVCSQLRDENRQLKDKVKDKAEEIAVVTMLYKVAKAEIEELASKLEKLVKSEKLVGLEKSEKLVGLELFSFDANERAKMEKSPSSSSEQELP